MLDTDTIERMTMPEITTKIYELLSKLGIASLIESDIMCGKASYKKYEGIIKLYYDANCIGSGMYTVFFTERYIDNTEQVFSIDIDFNNKTVFTTLYESGGHCTTATLNNDPDEINKLFMITVDEPVAKGVIFSEY